MVRQWSDDVVLFAPHGDASPHETGPAGRPRHRRRRQDRRPPGHRRRPPAGVELTDGAVIPREQCSSSPRLVPNGELLTEPRRRPRRERLGPSTDATGAPASPASGSPATSPTPAPRSSPPRAKARPPPSPSTPTSSTTTSPARSSGLRHRAPAEPTGSTPPRDSAHITKEQRHVQSTHRRSRVARPPDQTSARADDLDRRFPDTDRPEPCPRRLASAHEPRASHVRSGDHRSANRHLRPHASAAQDPCSTAYPNARTRKARQREC